MSSSQEKNNDIMRIYICGPHSTGKTTLLNGLTPYLKDVKVAEELARGIIQSHGWSRDDFLPDKHPDVFKQLNEEILSAQIDFDEKCTNLGQDFISDRALDPIVYIGFYLKEEDKRSVYRLPGINKWINRLKKSLVILVYPHAECIEDDSVRLHSSLEELICFHDSFEQELLNNGIPYIKLTELNRETRVTQVLNEIHLFRERLA